VKLKTLWVGKTQEEWLRRGIDEYAGRIRRYAPFEVAEVREEKGAPPAVMRERESARLMKLPGKGCRIILLDERGDELTSPEFAAFIARSRDTGATELAFVIGGAYGVSDHLRTTATKTMALSRMTFTHQMVRLFLLEQLYRAFTIINGESYHH
jgi:23S rRNA (pseudouridine1915-N3)-methyltransferase